MKNKFKEELVRDTSFFVISIFLIIFLYPYNLLLTLVLLITCLYIKEFWIKKHDVMFFNIAAIVGPLGEIICIRFGVWQYANPTIFGIPLWLPLVWGLSVTFIKRIAETFIKYG